MHPTRKRAHRSSRVCCVNGCSNSEYRNPHLNFYSFPGRDYEVERKQRWIEAVRLTKKDDSWMPTDNSRVCSIHFVGGKKSNILAHEAYVPSIFYGISNWKKVSNVEPATRSATNSEVAASSTVLAYEAFHTQDSYLLDSSEQTQPGIATIAFQTKDWTNNDPRCINTMFCWTGQNKASPQSNLFTESIPQPYTAQENEEKTITSGTVIENVEEIKRKNIACGTDIEMNPGFLGVASITSDEAMRCLTGLCPVAFHSFLELMVPGKYGRPMYNEKLSKENRLLLFLMKIKLGLEFTVLSTFFRIRRTTATQIFFEVLETLVEQTKTLIFWPSRESVRKKLPSSFHNYPTCRCIIDYTEIPIDSPPTIEQRILMYSNYKRCFTVKILIAITPDGFICGISKGYGGRATDSFIANDSGFLNLIESGDVVFAAKKFPQITSELVKRNATLVTPPFAFKEQFSAEQVDEGCKIASLKTHIKKAIQRVKSTSILNHITADLLPYIDQIMHMCCVIANMQRRLIKDDDRNR